MVRGLWLLLAILAVGCSGDAGDAPSFSGATSQDLGEVDFTGPELEVKHEFVLTNDSGRSLEIDRLVATCGCVTPTASATTVDPDAELRISTAMKVKEPGRKSEKVTVIFTDPDVALTLELRAVSRLVRELSADAQTITTNNREPARLTLTATTNVPGWSPAVPHIEPIPELDFNFEGWVEQVPEDGETTPDAAGSSSRWTGVLEIASRAMNREDPPGAAAGPIMEGKITLVIRAGQSNTLRIPFELKR